MLQNLARFKTWEQVLDVARRDGRLWYEAPMDAAQQAYPAKTVLVTRVFKNGKLRVTPLTNQRGAFTADSRHLDRFRRAPDPSDLIVEYVEGIYRVRWYRDGRCVVFSTVSNAVLDQFRDGKWGDCQLTPPYVREFCMKVRPTAAEGK